MRKMLVATIGVISIVIIWWSWQILQEDRVRISEEVSTPLPMPTTSSETEEEVLSEFTPTALPSPQTPFLAGHQIVYQITPDKAGYDPDQEAIDLRFERLYEREQRLGIPVKRGTPLVLNPQETP